MEYKKRGIVQRILFRLGEGLLVGVGVAIVLGVYNAMSHATDELRKTRSVLEKQVEINQKLKDQIELRDQELSRVRDLLVQTEAIADNVKDLAERLKAVEAASSSEKDDPFKTSEFDWNQFQTPSLRYSPDSDQWEGVSKFQLQSLQDAINVQRELQ